MVIDQDKTVFAGDGDEFFGYEIASGKQLFDVKHNDAKVGKATDVIDFGNDVVVISEKGLASYKNISIAGNPVTSRARGMRLCQSPYFSNRLARLYRFANLLNRKTLDKEIREARERRQALTGSRCAT